MPAAAPGGTGSDREVRCGSAEILAPQSRIGVTSVILIITADISARNVRGKQRAGIMLAPMLTSASYRPGVADRHEIC